MLTDPLRPVLPTDDDVRGYRDRGFWISPPVLAAELLEAAVRGQERFYAGERDHPAPGRTRYDDYDWTPEKGLDVLRKNDYASLQVDELAAVVRAAVLGRIAARLSGAAGIRLWHDQLLLKPPGGPGTSGNVGWHTDRQYWRTCSSEAMLTAWVPLEGADATLGTITFLEGSHRWEDPSDALDFFDGDLERQEAALARFGEVRRRVADLEPGQVSFHHCRTVHGSGPNVGDRPRRSVAVHLQTADNRHLGNGEYHRNDELCRPGPDGLPDYADPRICPALA